MSIQLTESVQGREQNGGFCEAAHSACLLAFVIRLSERRACGLRMSKQDPESLSHAQNRPVYRMYSCVNQKTHM